MGASGLTYQDLKAWMEVKGINLQPWEVEIVMGLSDVWLSIQVERSRK